MQQEEVFYPPTLDDIALDDQGRIIINDPQINDQLMAAAAKATAKPAGGTTINNQCNTVKGCGVKKTA